MQRLKPAHEIYKRLKWDNEFVPEGDFIVGYEDVFGSDGNNPRKLRGRRDSGNSQRFTLVRTTQDLIHFQFHRVRYFKNASTGQIVWDREKRLDLITSNYIGPLSTQDDSPLLREEDSELQEHSDITGKPVYSVKSKKIYLKNRRKKSLQKVIEEARGQLEEEKRIEEEHFQQHEDKMREVEERIQHFQELQVRFNVTDKYI
ncbi:8931_t:CDS:2 [Acaulospora morrowiae]|uniref:8931_t:CDS:1 n=1 Tax=Acaulospora morrowiae TaxID=94023 RepID=A0A9N9FIS3_9GLOM|nr:8931_t:CDS:2 [Acaulospora morrowiae]